jgi:hypothetical protein
MAVARKSVVMGAAAFTLSHPHHFIQQLLDASTSISRQSAAEDAIIAGQLSSPDDWVPALVVAHIHLAPRLFEYCMLQITRDFTNVVHLPTFRACGSHALVPGRKNHHIAML